MRILNGHFYTRQMKDDTSKRGKSLKTAAFHENEVADRIYWIYFDNTLNTFWYLGDCTLVLWAGNSMQHFPSKAFYSCILRQRTQLRKHFPVPLFHLFFLSTKQKKFCLTGRSNQRDQSSGCGRVSFSTTDPVPLSHPAFIFKRSLSKTQKVKCKVTDL